MNGGDNRMEMHYIDTGYPYTATGSFMDFFEGLTHVPMVYPPSIPEPMLQPVPQPMPIHDQENMYWSMNMHQYKFGYSGPESTYYYGPYDVNDHLQRLELERRTWEYATPMINEVPETSEAQPLEESVTEVQVQAPPEECSPNHQNHHLFASPDSPNHQNHHLFASPDSPDNQNHQNDQSDQNDVSSSEQVVWQDNVDPDSMTYEELLDLGETVGTQSRGLTQEQINLLPTTKCKFGNLFSKKRSGDRCVICQMRYKSGQRQMRLPCNHVYHSKCISKWLAINKICPICNNEVFGEDSSSH